MKNLPILGLTGLLLITSCKKDPSQNQDPANQNVENFSDLVAPNNFNFQATKNITVDVLVENPGFSNPFRIEIYDFVPTAGGSLIYSGFTTNDALSTDITVASSIKDLYIVKINPNGASTIQTVGLEGNSLSTSFGKKLAGKKIVPASPDCSTGCNQTISSGSWIDIKNSQVYCITGNISGFNDKNGNATIRICGNVTISGWVTIKGNTHLEITEGSTLTVGGINMNNKSGNYGEITVYSNATLNLNNNFEPSGTVNNYGTINVDDELYIKGTFTNNGSLNVDGNGYSGLSNSSSLINNGSVVISGYFTQNAGCSITNNCQLHIKKNFEMSSSVTNNGYIQVDQRYHSNSNALITFNNSAMMYVKGNADWGLNGDWTGSGTTSVVKIDGSISSNSAAQFSGNLEICVGGSTNLHTGTLLSPAIIACNGTYLATSSCNPEGNGTPTETDSDNDGISDENDSYPNDDQRAGNYYFPSENTFATIAFEDLWPSQGDYDFNDLVMGYRINWVTNAGNEIVDMVVDYSVRAIGAGQPNGFGVELNIASNAVASVTRQTSLSNLVSLNTNGTEASQSNAVIIFFTKATDELPNPNTWGVNTTPGASYSPVDTSQITVTFSSPLSSEPEFDPFMFANGKRDKEIHLAGFAPTDLASNTYFGKNADDSDPGSNRYYVTENNLPWVIVLPVNWDYPSETRDIVKAYKLFVNWVTSGNSSYTDWYQDLPGYRDNSLIY